MNKLLRPVACLAATAAIVGVAWAGSALNQSAEAGATFVETFDGAPAAATPFFSPRWDFSVHSRDDEGDTLVPMQAAHGANCQAPPASHTVSRYDQAVFQCANHMMTAINSPSYGAIYATPDHMVDFSRGEATVSVDVSTLVNSTRDWWDIWITPYGTHLQLPGEEWYPDLQDAPETAVHIKMVTFNGNQTGFVGEIFKNHQATQINGNYSTAYESVLTPDAKRRDTYELRISRGRLKFGMPDYNLWWVDTPVADLGFDRGVVQFGHHSYNPDKDDVVPNARANTWHWDDVKIAPAVEFDINHADRRRVTDQSTINFDHPAAANSHLRFSGLGSGFQFSTNGGASWQNAQLQKHRSGIIPDHFASYWTPIPAGTTSVKLRGGQARDITIFSSTPAANTGSVRPSSGAPAAPTGPSLRLLDTRPSGFTVDGTHRGLGQRPAGSITEVKVAGRGNVPANATTVAVNLAVVNPSSAGHATVYPCGESVPHAANINYAAGATISNTVISRVGAGGKICVHTLAATDLVIDANGAESGLDAVSPNRLLDTRPTGATVDGAHRGQGLRPAGSITEVKVTGRGNIPADATTVAVNLAVVDPLVGAHATVFPCGQPVPHTANVNYQPGATISNSVISSIGQGGKICIYTVSPTHLVVDGSASSVNGLTAVTAERMLDTRASGTTIDNQYRGQGLRPAGSITEVQIAGRGRIPADAKTVAVNLAVVAPMSFGHATVYPCGEAVPHGANINYAPGSVISNSVITELGAGGKVCIHTYAATYLVLDATASAS